MKTKWTMNQLDELYPRLEAARDEARRLVAQALGQAVLDLPATALLFAIRAATAHRGMLLNDMLALGRAMGVEEPAAWRDGVLTLLVATGRVKKVGARYVAPGWSA